MAMVGVVSGSLYRRTHSLSRLAWSWVGGRFAPFYIHQMNRVNSRNGSAVMTAPYDPGASGSRFVGCDTCELLMDWQPVKLAR